MAYELDAKAVATAFAAGAVQDGGREIPFAVETVGNLQVTTGAIGASDPLVDPNPAAFMRTVPAGSYRATVAIAAFGDDERIAFARLEIADRPVARWGLATVAGQDAATLDPDAFFGYGVDSGTGSFMDIEGGRLLDARMRAEPDYFESMIETLDLTYRNTRSWAAIRPNDDRPENILCFSSGWGDGAYPTFYGLDADDAVVAFVTDFLVFGGDPAAEGDEGDEPARRPTPWWRFWARD